MTCEEFIRALHAEGRTPTDALLEHGQRCAECGRLWELDRLLLLSRKPPMRVSMSAELRAELSAQPDPPPAVRSIVASNRLAAILLPIAVALALGLTLFARADLSAGLPRSFWVGAATLCAMLAVAVQLHLHRGRDGFGVPPWLRWAAVSLALLGFEAFALLDMFHPLNSAVHPRQDCFLFGSSVALLVGWAAFASARRSVFIGARSAGALAGCVGGLAGVTFLHVHCGAAAGLHLVAVHSLPLVFAIALGAYLGRRQLAA